MADEAEDKDVEMVGNHIRYLKYPIPKKVPGELYFVGKDGYIYSATMARGGRHKGDKNG